jgi:hypothetical protein
MQRGGDLVRLGWEHVRSRMLSLKQGNTGAQVDIPVLEEVEAMPESEHLTLLVTEFGKPFTAAGSGNWFREQCTEAAYRKA